MHSKIKFGKSSWFRYAPNNISRGCAKRFSPPAAAEYSSERHVIFTISRSEIVKMTCLSKHHSARSAAKRPFAQPHILLRGCVKSILPPAAAAFSSDRRLIFTISRSEIVKMRRLSKHYLARSAVKNLFIQPLKTSFGAKRRKKTFCTTP
ncbi:MAG: hypothetical protein ACOYOO_13315, partial [Saprospiraceae bacterium]